MSYTIYVSDHCTDCVKVIDYMTSSTLDCQVVNVDQSKDTLPVNIFIVPALTNGERLLAYGEQDIIRVLEGNPSPS